MIIMELFLATLTLEFTYLDIMNEHPKKILGFIVTSKAIIRSERQRAMLALTQFLLVNLSSDKELIVA